MNKLLICRTEKGRSDITIETLTKIAGALEIPVAAFSVKTPITNKCLEAYKRKASVDTKAIFFNPKPLKKQIQHLLYIKAKRSISPGFF